ncbi:MAG: hydrogenase 4 subunit F, partial [Nitrosomonadales bacterium]|nr:hydrogenase 4 subunit F [Nitrosomonadales bacterium]
MEIFWILAIPLIGSLLLALFGYRRFAPELNSVMSFGTFVASAFLTVRVITEGSITAMNEQFFVDPFNVFLVALTAFIAFTTSLFSRPYMRIEQAHGKLTINLLRLYHSMYQLFTFTMLLVLLTNNLGIMWVAMEAATLTTVLLVSLYRTPASLEAAWKYFILCGVGLAQALFGTILLYFAAEKVLGAGGTALLWTHLDSVKTHLEPTVLSLAFVF